MSFCVSSPAQRNEGRTTRRTSLQRLYRATTPSRQQKNSASEPKPSRETFMQETPSCRTTPEHPLHQDFLDPRIADTGKTLVASPSEHLRRCSISLPQ